MDKPSDKPNEFKLSVANYHRFLATWIPGGNIPAWKAINTLQLVDLDDKRTEERRKRISVEKAEMTRQRNRAAKLDQEFGELPEPSIEAATLSKMLRGG